MIAATARRVEVLVEAGDPAVVADPGDDAGRHLDAPAGPVGGHEDVLLHEAVGGRRAADLRVAQVGQVAAHPGQRRQVVVEALDERRRCCARSRRRGRTTARSGVDVAGLDGGEEAVGELERVDASWSSPSSSSQRPRRRSSRRRSRLVGRPAPGSRWNTGTARRPDGGGGLRSIRHSAATGGADPLADVLDDLEIPVAPLDPGLDPIAGAHDGGRLGDPAVDPDPPGAAGVGRHRARLVDPDGPQPLVDAGHRQRPAVTAGRATVPG